MKKTKFKLNNLNIRSFTTNLDAKNKETIAGREEALPTSPLKWLWKNVDSDLIKVQIKWETMGILLESFMLHSEKYCPTQYQTCNVECGPTRVCK